jgi:PEP-CTERM motif
MKQNVKKFIITTVAVSALSLSALAQGSLNVNATVANDPGITLQGVNATSTTLATTYFSGTMSLQVWFLAGTTVPANIDALNGINGTAAAALLGPDGFTEVSTTTFGGSTVGSVNGTISGGSFAFGGNIGLGSAVPTATQGVLALVGTAVGGANAGWIGVIDFVNSTGGNPTTVPAGTPATLTGWGALNQNLVLTSPVPEPSTMALAGLGGVAALLFRRRK